jgi:hypothetical protein
MSFLSRLSPGDTPQLGHVIITSLDHHWHKHVLRIQKINCEPDYSRIHSRIPVETSFCIASNIYLVSSCPLTRSTRLISVI